MFITLEGGEGVGKTTQAKAISARLTKAGYEVLLTREPGGSDLGTDIRKILIDRHDFVDPITELLIFAADLAQHVAIVIRPALNAGKIVVCDRYVDSIFAYQGFGRRLNLISILQINAIATGGLMPALTFWLDIDPQSAIHRLRTKEMFDSASLEFHNRVRDGFKYLASSEPSRIAHIDASLSSLDITDLLARKIADLLPTQPESPD